MPKRVPQLGSRDMILIVVLGRHVRLAVVDHTRNRAIGADRRTAGAFGALAVRGGVAAWIGVVGYRIIFGDQVQVGEFVLSLHFGGDDTREPLGEGDRMTTVTTTMVAAVLSVSATTTSASTSVHMGRLTSIR